jgi:leucine dehydrogenase
MAARVDTVPVAPHGQAAAPGALLAIDHEELVIRRGRRSGIYCAIAVHSTTLGPALGGCRMWRYPDQTEAARDALRLSRAMTLKASAAGLDLGGGKGVICLPPDMPPPEGELRRDVLLDFADAVNALEGSYITAEDVGTSTRDMVTVAQGTRYVTGLPVVHGGSGDPSAFTALGVEAAIRACCRERFGSRKLEGRRIAVVGCGRVGEQLARRLAVAGAQLLLADIDERKRGLAAVLPRAHWVSPQEALLAPVDVLSPCALGGVVDEASVEELRCAVICGSANNQLADERLAERLAERDVLYAPDFIVNSGGLINVSLELSPGGYDAGFARERVAGIEGVMGRILDQAQRRGTTPLAAAIELARARLEASAEERDPARADASARRNPARPDASAAERKISSTAPRAEIPPRPGPHRPETPLPVGEREEADGHPAGRPRITARGTPGAG